MNESQFWQKASDIYNQYHDRYKRAILTDDEVRQDILKFNWDMRRLVREWEDTTAGGK
jgi:hypothetical protein